MLKLLSPFLEPSVEPTVISLNFFIDKLDNQYRHILDYGIDKTTQHSEIFLRVICSCLIKHY